MPYNCQRKDVFCGGRRVACIFLWKDFRGGRGLITFTSTEISWHSENVRDQAGYRRKGRTNPEIGPNRVIAYLNEMPHISTLKSAFRNSLLCCMFSFAAFSQSVPAPSASERVAAESPDAAKLTRLLTDFLTGASRNDVAMHERFWAEDLIYTSSSGKRMGKADIMRDVRSEPAPPPNGAESAMFTAEDIRIQQYGTTAIVAFRLVGVTTKDRKTEVSNYLNSGTFLKRDNKWQVVNWQATRMPATEPKP